MTLRLRYRARTHHSSAMRTSAKQGLWVAGWLLGSGVLAAAQGRSFLPKGIDAVAGNTVPGNVVPSIRTTALDGHAVELPAALSGHLTVLILGFGKHSAEATTAWEKPVRTQFAHPPAIGFYDMAMLQEVPSFVRSLVVHSIRKKVPDVLQPNFLPLFDHEEEWKHVAGYAADQPDAAYVLLVDGRGTVRWSTHEAFSPAAFTRLRGATQQLATN